MLILQTNLNQSLYQEILVVNFAIRVFLQRKLIFSSKNYLLSNPKSKKIHYGILSENPNSIHIIETLNEKLLDKLWHYVEYNSERQVDSICKNPNAIHIIEKEIYKKKVKSDIVN